MQNNTITEGTLAALFVCKKSSRRGEGKNIKQNNGIMEKDEGG